MAKNKTEEEEWRPMQHLVGTKFEKYYEVSNQGRVRSLDRTIERSGVPYRIKGHVLALHKTGGERGKGWRMGVHISCDTVNFTLAVGKLVHEAFIGPVHPGWLIHMKDWDDTNMRADNVMQLESMQALADQPGYKRRTGVHHHMTIFSPKQIAIIRSSPESTNRLAALLGVTRMTLRRIRKGEG